MPSSGRACRLVNELFEGSLGTFFVCLFCLLEQFPCSFSPPVRLPHFFLSICGRSALAPRKLLPARAKARKVATADLTAVGSRAETQQHACAKRRIIVMLGPRAQLRPQTLRTAGKLP